MAIITGTELPDVLVGTLLDDRIDGRGGNDALFGLSGNDYLIGGAGTDDMVGSTGDDTYAVDIFAGDQVLFTDILGVTFPALVINLLGDLIEIQVNLDGVQQILTVPIAQLQSSDEVIENAGEGRDTVRASVSYVLDPNVEDLILTGTAPINGTGNNLDNLIVGNSAANRINGDGGADTMRGGDGNDTYVVNIAADAVIELASAGIDLVLSDISYALTANVENLTLIGTAPINGTGNSLRNTITGNSAANVINGGAGADRMLGGAGNDTYIVDNRFDRIIENSSQGVDLVRSSVSFTLYANIENLVLTGTALFGRGNGLDNVITGNASDNFLNGGAGADTLTGGLGNDTYRVDNVGDVVREFDSGGTDKVNSSISYVLGANVENLKLVGTAAINGTGNGLDNIVGGNTASNILDGGAGADRLFGGGGDDTYVVDNLGDRVKEYGSGGTDTVNSSVNFKLSARVENLVLTGDTAVFGTGNDQANAITGNSANNILSGRKGNDTIDGGAGADRIFGGAGNDFLTGGDGADRFIFDAQLKFSPNIDQIIDFSVTDDTIVLDQTIFQVLTTLGTLSADAFRNGTSALDADDRIIYDSTTGRIFFDADGNGAAAQVLFAQVTAGLALTNADFFIVG